MVTIIVSFIIFVIFVVGGFCLVTWLSNRESKVRH